MNRLPKSSKPMKDVLDLVESLVSSPVVPSLVPILPGVSAAMLLALEVDDMLQEVLSRSPRKIILRREDHDQGWLWSVGIESGAYTWSETNRPICQVGILANGLVVHVEQGHLRSDGTKRPRTARTWRQRKCGTWNVAAAAEHFLDLLFVSERGS